MKIDDLISKVDAYYQAYGRRGVEDVFFRQMTQKDRDELDRYLVEIKHPLAFQAGTQEDRFKRLFFQDYPGHSYKVRRSGSRNPCEFSNPYRTERIVKPATMRKKGLTKYRSTVTPSGHVLRLAYPPGRRRKGAGELQAVLHPNPPVPGAVLIYNRTQKVVASKAGIAHECDAACKRSKHRYFHNFRKAGRIWGLPDGNLFIERK